MKKAKYISTRKHKTVKRSILCLVLLLFICCVTTFYGLFPSFAVRESEEYFGTGKTDAVISYISAKPLKFTGIGYFTFQENENALVHTCLKWHLQLGWYRAATAVVDCSGDEPVDIGFHGASGSKNGSVYYFFGRINDPDIRSVEIELDYNYDGSIDKTISCPTDILHDDKQYFHLQYIRGEDEPYCHCYAACYDSSGILLYRAKIEQGASSSIG